jgi:hypothetical protein
VRLPVYPHACEGSIPHAQVECHPAGPILAKIQGYRATAGGFVSMTFGNVAGSGTFTAVDLRTSLQVRCYPAHWEWNFCMSMCGVWRLTAV